MKCAKYFRQKLSTGGQKNKIPQQAIGCWLTNGSFEIGKNGA
jgi:hypothetical protein